MSSIKICVENIPPTKTERDVAELFEQFGKVRKFNVADKLNRYDKRIGFVEMPSSSGEIAIEALNNHHYENYSLKVYRVARVLTIDDNNDN